MKPDAWVVAILGPILWYFAWGQNAGMVGVALGLGVLIIDARRKTPTTVAIGGALLAVLAIGTVVLVVQALLILAGKRA